MSRAIILRIYGEIWLLPAVVKKLYSAEISSSLPKGFNYRPSPSLEYFTCIKDGRLPAVQKLDLFTFKARYWLARKRKQKQCLV